MRFDLSQTLLTKGSPSFTKVSPVVNSYFLQIDKRSTGTVQPAEQPFIRTIPGAGPKHLALSENGDLIFSAEEISSSICSYTVNKENDGL